MLKRSIILLAVCLCIYESDYIESIYRSHYKSENTNYLSPSVNANTSLKYLPLEYRRSSYRNSQAYKAAIVADYIEQHSHKNEISGTQKTINYTIDNNLSNKHLISGFGTKVVDNFLLPTLGILEAGTYLALSSMIAIPELSLGVGIGSLLIRLGTMGYEEKAAKINSLVNQSFEKLYSKAFDSSNIRIKISSQLNDPKYADLISACSESSLDLTKIESLATDKQGLEVASIVLYANMQHEYDRYMKMINGGNIAMAGSAFITTMITDLKIHQTSKRIEKLNETLDAISKKL